MNIDEWMQANNDRYDDMLYSTDALLYLLFKLNVIDEDDWGSLAEEADLFIGRVDKTYYNSFEKRDD